jgi:hypothetical protein
VPKTLDLWPAIRQRVWMRQAEAKRSHMAPFNGRRRQATLVVLGVILVVGLVAGTTYQAQAAVGAWVSRLGIGVTLVPWAALPQPTPVTGWATVAPSGAAPAASAHPVAPAQAVRVQFIPLDEARKTARFPIRIPSWIPAGYSLAGALVENPENIHVQYYRDVDAAGRPHGAIGISEILGATTSSYSFPASRDEEATVNGHSATYIHGSWQGDGAWNDAADLHTLSWQADGMTFMLQADETGLSRDDVVQIAESLR